MALLPEAYLNDARLPDLFIKFRSWHLINACISYILAKISIISYRFNGKRHNDRDLVRALCHCTVIVWHSDLRLHITCICADAYTLTRIIGKCPSSSLLDLTYVREAPRCLFQWEPPPKHPLSAILQEHWPTAILSADVLEHLFESADKAAWLLFVPLLQNTRSKAVR